MARDYVWTDDTDRRRESTEVINASDVTEEILLIARVQEDAWFSNDVWIDWRSFFADLDGSVIPSTGLEIALGDEDGSPAKNRIQRHIQKRRMAGPGRGGDPRARRGPTGGQA
jgi:hypothetical protein